MDFALTDEQQRLHDEIVRFASSELNDDLIHRDAESAFFARSLEAMRGVRFAGPPGTPKRTVVPERTP